MNGRADIVAPLLNTIFEVLITETDSRFIKKINYYPEGFTLVKVRHLDNFNQWFRDHYSKELYDSYLSSCNVMTIID